MPYNETSQRTKYIWDHFRHLMTDFECRADRAAMVREKTSPDDEARSLKFERYARRNDPDVNAALSDGWEAFRRSVSRRILAEQGDEILNRCPQCRRIVRTPRARQCFWCGHDWHEPDVRPLAQESSMPSLAIVALCIASAVVYGILHDQVTARLCVEYFTIGHPDIFHTDSPTMLGIGWGIIATWWMGLLLGIPLAIAARAGSRPKRDVRSLLRPIAILLMIMGVCATLGGILGFVLGRIEAIRLAERIPHDLHIRFLAAGGAHLTSYLVGFVGGLVVIALVWRSRRRPDQATPRSPANVEPEP